jgi:DNA adenine methylase
VGIAAAPMGSIFRYPGGKTRPGVRRWILAHRPADVREYREPFVGGGGVFFALNAGPAVWLNDLNPGLVAVYQALRDGPAEFIARCRAVPPAAAADPVCEAGPRGGQRVNARLKAVFDTVAFDENADPAFRYYFVNRTVFGGRVNYDIPSRLYFSNPEGWNVVGTDALDRAAAKLAGCKVTCGDFAPLLSEPGDGVWVYCDPPYVVNTNLSRTSQLYQHGFTEDDHRRFAAAVRASPHKVAVSYDDDPDGFVRSLFPAADGFRIVENSWQYVGTTNEEKATGRELLILNYDLPRTALNLFDVGADEDGGDLSGGEVGELEQLEAAVDRCRKSFVDAGLALQVIRDRRLYRSDYKTFEAYCTGRWGMNRDYANKLVRAAEVTSEMDSIVSKRPEVESQARELTRLDCPDDRLAAWRAAVEEAGERAVTAKLVKKHVAALLPPREVPPPDWRRALTRAWATVPEGERGAALDFLTSLAAEEVAHV